jgi:hypothetical protein
MSCVTDFLWEFQVDMGEMIAFFHSQTLQLLSNLVPISETVCPNKANHFIGSIGLKADWLLSRRVGCVCGDFQERDRWVRMCMTCRMM